MNSFIIDRLARKEVFSDLYEIRMKSGDKEKRFLRKIKKVIFNKVDQGIENFRFQMEELILLDHPNIAKFYDYREDLFNFYIMIEHCTGGNFFERMVALMSFTENLTAEFIR